MRDSSHFWNAYWTLLDQGIVSLGSFIVNIFLARDLSPTEYGIFALLWGGLLALQQINAALVFHPMSVRLVVADGEHHKQLLNSSAALATLACIPQCIVLSLTLLTFGRGDILPSAVTWFILWQMQEAMRRGLFAGFRHKAAIVGDTISYIGQVAVIGLFLLRGPMNLTTVLYCMAATSGVAALVQAYQLGLSLCCPHDFRRTMLDFWIVGRWALVNNLVSQLRGQFLLWQVAAYSGAVIAASFQATQNVVNLVNPIIFGLCNIIPQSAAHAQAHGNAHAWRSARIYALLGLPPTFAYYAFALIAPGFILNVFYGADSPYIELSFAVRLLAIAAIAGYGAEMVSSFLHGANAAGIALVINAIGTGLAILLALPLTAEFGLNGVFLTLVFVNTVRSAASLWAIKRMIAKEQPSTI
jgi:O-antigen/teichoic acid export membrane protein